MTRVRRSRLTGAFAAFALALAPALPGGTGAQAAAAPTKGYWFVAGDGGIFSFGDASFAGSTGGVKLNQPIVGMAPTPTGRGYWFVASDGGIFSFGDAKFYGSTGDVKLNRPIVGMAPTPTGRGYWFVASDGGIFSFGDASFYGSTGAARLAKPIVGMAATPTGRGYWFVASDGGVFNYGDAKFHGSGASSNLRAPVVGITSTPSGQGYFLAAADGTVVAFGDAVFRGSMGGRGLKSPIVGLAPTSTGAGYWLVAADGGIFAFGDAGFYGCTGAVKLNRAIVGMAAAPQKGAFGSFPTSPGGSTFPTNPGGGTGSGGGTSPVVPGNPGTTPTTTVPGSGPPIDWGPAGSTSILAKAAAGGGTAFRPWMSSDGRYLAFDSDGKRVLGQAEIATVRDVYLYDRTTGSMERISTGLNGARADVPSSCGSNVCGSQRPTVSADGRFVAFWSNATNLVADDTNGHYDAFLYDRLNKTMTRISVGPNGEEGDGDSRRPVVSRDGSTVVFESAAANFVPKSCTLVLCNGGDKNGADDVFAYATDPAASPKLSLVSATSGGDPGNGASNRPSLSENGRKIVFASLATNLVASDGNGNVEDVFLRDVASGQTSLVSTGPNGQGDKASGSPSMSADGNWVSFDTKATNFAAGDTGGDTDVYLKNLATGAIEQASVRTGGGQASGNGATLVGSDSTISRDGRFIAFWANAADLVDGDRNGHADVFVRDRVAGTTTRVTSTNGTEGDDDSYSPALSGDGRFVAFDSKATSLDLSGGGSTRGQDLFVHVNF